MQAAEEKCRQKQKQKKPTVIPLEQRHTAPIKEKTNKQRNGEGIRKTS